MSETAKTGGTKGDICDDRIQNVANPHLCLETGAMPHTTALVSITVQPSAKCDGLNVRPDN